MSVKLHVVRTVGVMIALPMVFLALYLPAFLVLPETLAVLADLPRDLSLILLVDTIVVPLASLGLYVRARRLEAKGPQGPGMRRGAREVC